jgi:hypothetical protein
MFLSFIAALLTLIALAIDIALYAIVHNRVHSLDGVQVRSVAAPGIANSRHLFSSLGIADTCRGLTGFWITLVSLILLLVAGGIGWLGRRRSRMTGATDYLAPEKPGFFSRIRRF